MKAIKDNSVNSCVPTERLNWSSWLAFAIFLIVLTKDILVSGYEVIPVRGLLNRQLSWFLIFPISLIGLVLAIQEIGRTIIYRKKSGMEIVNINLILSVPILLYIAFALLFL